MMGQRDPVQSLHAATVEAIARWIIGGRYGSGSLLPNEGEIGEELQVSRTVVREAVRTLVAKGMLATRRRLGTEVTQQAAWSMFDRQVLGWRLRFAPSPDLIRDLYEFRMSVEVHAAERCASDPGFDRAELMVRLRRLEAAGEAGAEDWAMADLAFHSHILVGSHNQFFLYLEPILDTVFDMMMARHKIEMEQVRKAIPAHRSVAEAIDAGDPVAARKATEQIVRRGTSDLSDLLDDWRKRLEAGIHPAAVRQRRAYN